LNKNIAITLDVDWAPDFIIDQVAFTLIEHSVKATWFITHKSPAIKRLAQYPELFELGIHPNFSEGSTQGSEPKAIMDHCFELVPDAESMRTHDLVQSTSLLKLVMTRYPIKVDVSIFLPYQFSASPFVYRSWEKCLLRIPYAWEDDHEMEQEHPVWSAEHLLGSAEPLYVLNFHPIHIYLNSRNMNPYLNVKKLGIPLCDCLPHHLEAQVRQDTVGTGDLFKNLIPLIKNNYRSFNIIELYKHWHEINKIEDRLVTCRTE